MHCRTQKEVEESVCAGEGGTRGQAGRRGGRGGGRGGGRSTDLLDVSMTMSAVTSAGLFSPTLGFLTSMMVYSAMGAAMRAHPLNPIWSVSSSLHHQYVRITSKQAHNRTYGRVSTQQSLLLTS